MDEKEAEARPLMGTIFLVYICMSVCMSVVVQKALAEIRGPNARMLKVSIVR